MSIATRRVSRPAGYARRRQLFLTLALTAAGLLIAAAASPPPAWAQSRKPMATPTAANAYKRGDLVEVQPKVGAEWVPAQVEETKGSVRVRLVTDEGLAEKVATIPHTRVRRMPAAAAAELRKSGKLSKGGRGARQGRRPGDANRAAGEHDRRRAEGARGGE